MPSRNEADACGIFRSMENISAIVCSAAAIELAEAVFMTGIFFEVAVGTSMLSTPAPARTMSFIEDAFSTRSLVKVVAERMTMHS